MMATWFAYCTLLALLLGVAAAAAERLLRLYGLPARGAWAAALAAALVLPLLPRAADGPPAPAQAVAAPAEVISTGRAVHGAGIVVAPPASPRGPAAAWPVLVERHLPRLWLGSSLALACALAVGTAGMLRRRRRWRREVVAGAPVLVSGDTGPAVAGFFRPAIVLPEWVLAWDEGRQRMMVEHELEHIRARDPLLILGSWLAVILFPWNPVVWWQARRLRLAVEMDCDARVLRARPGVGAYGRLLLEVGRLSSGRWAVAAFSEPVSSLERRIRGMTARPPRHRARLAAALLLAAAAAAAGAGVLPGPTLRLWASEPPRAAPVDIEDHPASVLVSPALPTGPIDLDARAAAVVADTVMPRLLNAAAVARALDAAYPELLRSAGVGGSVVVELETDERGEVRSARSLRASHEHFAAAAEEALLAARFTPARVGERPVSVRFTVPVSFVPPPAMADVPTVSNLERPGAFVSGGHAAGVEPVPGPAPAPRGSESPGQARGAAAAAGRVEELARREAHVRGEEERTRRSEAGYRRWEEVAKDALRLHQPAVARSGTGENGYVWLMADATGRVVGSGTQPLRWQSVPALGAATKVWHVDTVREQLSALHPSVRIENVSILMTTRDGQPLHIAWVRLQPGSSTP